MGYHTTSVDTSFRISRERCGTFNIGEMVYVDFNRTKTYLGAVVSKSPGIGVVRVIIMDEAFGSNNEVAVPVGCCRKIGTDAENP